MVSQIASKPLCRAAILPSHQDSQPSSGDDSSEDEEAEREVAVKRAKRVVDPAFKDQRSVHTDANKVVDCKEEQRQVPETTTQFKKQQLISIPDILDMHGQVTRCYSETCLQKFVSDNLQRLRHIRSPVPAPGYMIKEFAGLNSKLNLMQGFVSTGMGDLQSKLLTVAEAKKRKVDIESQGRKQQKLLQTEQPGLLQAQIHLNATNSHALKPHLG
ncbi:TPA: hypothetical protein ACH3X1_001167 [Trebouxia sp. C0004]